MCCAMRSSMSSVVSSTITCSRSKLHIGRVGMGVCVFVRVDGGGRCITRMHKHTHNTERDTHTARTHAPRQDGRRQLDVLLQRLALVVAAVDGVGGGQDGRARVEGGLDAGLGDGDRLLLHGLVDGDLAAAAGGRRMAGLAVLAGCSSTGRAWVRIGAP